MSRCSWIRGGAQIYQRSFAIILAESGLSRFTAEEEPIAVRVITACGQVQAAADLATSQDLVIAAKRVLAAGAPILCDSRLVADAVTRARLPADNPVVCTLNDPAIAETAARVGNARSAAALDLWRDKLVDSLVVIGNAPTALFRLLELLDEGWSSPAAIVGMPVGFLGAAESKESLIAYQQMPYFVARGRRRGSATAAAAANALASTKE